MGLVLDSSVLIVAEREARPVSSLLAELQEQHGETEIVLSSITLIELEHGLHRAQTPEQAQKRRNYLDEVFAAIPVESFSREMAQIAAKVDADARRVGKVIPFADLLIGATALHHGYALGTRNLRHFRMIFSLSSTRPLPSRTKSHAVHQKPGEALLDLEGVQKFSFVAVNVPIGSDHVEALSAKKDAQYRIGAGKLEFSPYLTLRGYALIAVYVAFGVFRFY